MTKEMNIKQHRIFLEAIDNMPDEIESVKSLQLRYVVVNAPRAIELMDTLSSAYALMLASASAELEAREHDA